LSGTTEPVAAGPQGVPDPGEGRDGPVPLFFQKAGQKVMQKVIVRPSYSIASTYTGTVEVSRAAPWASSRICSKAVRGFTV